MTESRLGYRSYFLVQRELEPHAEAAAFAQLNSWLRTKNYAVDAMQEDAEVSIGQGVTATLIRLSEQDGSETLRARIIERQSGAAAWESELTVHTPGRQDESASVLLDISGPSRPRTPRLARLLTEALPAHDSRALLREKPLKIEVSDVEKLAEAVCDPYRRGLLFVSGMSGELPHDAWYSYVQELLRDTTGLASSYFLTTEATQAFAEIMGATHATGPGTVRTYLPDADPASDLDALRHRILGTERILRDSGRRLAFVLGGRAQEEALQADLPHKLHRLERRLAERTDELLVRSITEPADGLSLAEPQDEAHTQEFPHGDVEDESAPTEVENTEVTRQAGPIARWVDRARSAIKRVLGVDEPLDEDWDRFTELALVGKNAGAARQGVEAQLTRLRDSLASQDQRQRETSSRLQDEQLEHASTAEELDETRRRNAYLESLVQKSNQVGELYADAGAEQQAEPDDFEALLTELAALEHVVFTGDADVVLALDQQDPLGRWARKAWRALSALEDYAAASADGRCSADVQGYLKSPPNGCRGYSINKHASTESEDVQKNPKYLSARFLPVPPEVSPDGYVAMLAHFKIAQSGLVSPRLHYHDATSRTGKVYVGHIGPHLPTKRTN